MYRVFKYIFSLALIATVILTVDYSSPAQARYAMRQIQSIDQDIRSSVLFDSVVYSGLTAGVIRERPLVDSPALRAFYKERHNSPYWIKNDKQYDHIHSLVSFLEYSWTHGLNPEQYHVSEIKRLIAYPTPISLAQAELLLTDAAVRYGRDLSGMRIVTSSTKSETKFWQQPKEAGDILNIFAQGFDPLTLLKSMGPKNEQYNALRKELIRLQNEEASYDHLLPLKLGNYFKPGQKHDDVEKLRQRMGVKFDESTVKSKTHYDPALVKAVEEFQLHHGLEPDGVIGPKTLALINRTKQDRINQLVANLERLRWMNEDMPARYLWVNIPSQTMKMVEKHRVQDEMKVIVGMPWRQTRSFNMEIEGVRFNPTWTVPLKLKMRDILPKVKKDIGYLEHKQITLLQGYGRNEKVLDPHSIDWKNMTWRQMSKIRMVQTPGDHNALGRIRVLMQNDFNIYLHDTPQKELFGKVDRTLSSGCVRMEDPERVARFILKHNKDWSPRDVNKIIQTNKTTEIEAAQKLPVYIVYQTVWQDDKGRIVYGPDVYKRDKKLIQALKEQGALPQSTES